MTIADAARRLRDRLAAAGVPTPDVDAELLVAHVLGWPRARVRSADAIELDPEAVADVTALGQRRAAREPLQLLVGTVGFRHVELAVCAGVFIPRPETEVLAGEALQATPRGGLVVEPCTGTGAVACAVADEAERRDGIPPAVVATDIDARAVRLARANAVRCRAAVDVRHGDLFGPVPPALRGRVDVVVANPPYVAAGETDTLEPEVTEWDPPRAFVAGQTGHEIVDRVVADAATWLRAGGRLLLEVADCRAAETARRCERAGYVGVRVVADLTGRDRVVVARIR